MILRIILGLLSWGFCSCMFSACNIPNAVSAPSETALLVLEDTIAPTAGPNIDSILASADSSWVDLALLLPMAKYDIRYADTNNFMQLKVYECAACYTRLEVAKALMKIQKELDSLGLVFKFFDCYRPSAAQWALWNKMPDARYVHPPKLGSMHSRGNALDLTFFDVKKDKELDMGTTFDFFGKEAYWNFTGHSKTVIENRNLLRKLMYQYGFITVPTEWWHFAYNSKQFPLSDMHWNCH